MNLLIYTGAELTVTTPGPLLHFLTTNHERPLAAQDLRLARRASQILVAGPECQQKIAGLEMKLSYLSI